MEISDLRRGIAIPAHPLALTPERKLDEKRQRSLTRYYLEAGAGGVAVGVHTTQFAIRDHGLLRTVLELAAEEAKDLVRISGICGVTQQAVGEAELANDLNYHAGLLNLGALKGQSDDAVLDHCRAVADVIPLFGFHLQAAVGGRDLTHAFWRRFAEIPNVVAIKIAAFDRYRTLDVVRAVAEAGRAGDIALYTGNDDNIVLDLLTEFTVGGARQRFVGGLLGHWAVWTRSAVKLFEEIRALKGPVPAALLTKAAAVTDMNGAVFDAANGFAGCIPGVHEVLRRQGLLDGIGCLDPNETLSPGQAAEIDRVCRAYPELAT